MQICTKPKRFYIQVNGRNECYGLLNKHIVLKSSSSFVWRPQSSYVDYTTAHLVGVASYSTWHKWHIRQVFKKDEWILFHFSRTRQNGTNRDRSLCEIVTEEDTPCAHYLLGTSLTLNPLTLLAPPLSCHTANELRNTAKSFCFPDRCTL